MTRTGSRDRRKRAKQPVDTGDSERGESQRELKVHDGQSACPQRASVRDNRVGDPPAVKDPRSCSRRYVDGAQARAPSDTGSATAGGMAAALMLATSRLLASTGRPSPAVERSLASNARSALSRSDGVFRRVRVLRPKQVCADGREFLPASSYELKRLGARAGDIGSRPCICRAPAWEAPSR